MPANEVTPSTMQTLINWITLAQPFLWAVVLWGWWSLKKLFVRHEECAKCRADLEARQQTEHDKRALSLQSSFANLPTVEGLQALALTLKEIEGNIKGLTSKMDGQFRALERLETSVDMLNQVHMEKK